MGWLHHLSTRTVERFLLELTPACLSPCPFLFSLYRLCWFDFCDVNKSAVLAVLRSALFISGVASVSWKGALLCPLTQGWPLQVLRFCPSLTWSARMILFMCSCQLYHLQGWGWAWSVWFAGLTQGRSSVNTHTWQVNEWAAEGLLAGLNDPEMPCGSVVTVGIRSVLRREEMEIEEEGSNRKGGRSETGEIHKCTIYTSFISEAIQVCDK